MSRLTDFLRRELSAVALVSAYFLVWFLVIAVIKFLLLSEYEVGYVATGSAIVGALVMAKIVVVLDETRVGERLVRKAAVLHILYRSVTYTVAVFLVLVAEKIVHAMLDDASLSEAIAYVWEHKNWPHILTSTILIGMSLVFYNALSVINRALGKKGLLGLLRAPLYRLEEEVSGK